MAEEVLVTARRKHDEQEKLQAINVDGTVFVPAAAAAEKETDEQQQ